MTHKANSEDSQKEREAIASVQHEIWAHWVKYLFSQCYSDAANYPGCLVIPADKVERWTRQMALSYSELSDKEQENNREQADKVLKALDAIELPKTKLRAFRFSGGMKTRQGL
jgi:ABC-type dipeptide/oligopeptide/nickel transport system ATPase component